MEHAAAAYLELLVEQIGAQVRGQSLEGVLVEEE